MSKRVCLGFGEKAGVCQNDAGGYRSPYWCIECDKERIAHITAQMEKISASFSEGGVPGGR